MIVSIFPETRDPMPRQVEVSWDDLAARLSSFLPVGGVTKEAKLRCPAWCPVDFGGETRSTASVRGVWALVLDYDGGMPLHAALDRWAGYERLAHTSWSTSSEQPKCRIVMPLAQPMPGDGWSALYEHVRAVIDHGEGDVKCKNPDRIYYVPAVGAGGPHAALRRRGRLLDLRPVAEQVRRIESRRQADHRQRVEEQRRRLPPVVSEGEAERELRRRLEIDPQARAAAGEALGGTIRGAEPCVRGVTCPRCGQPSVWWPVTPRAATGAMCHHRKTCEWGASIFDLLRGNA